MTRAEIIALANALTENKIAPNADPNLLFIAALQKFCSELRFQWRKRSFTFNTIAGTQGYELDAHATGHITATPALTDLSVEEIVKVLIVDSSGSVGELDAITDDCAIAEALEHNTQGKPSGYFADPNSPSQIDFTAIPDAAYKIRVIALMEPDPTTESQSDKVLLVPPRFHRGIAHAIESEIWRTTYGMQDPKFIGAEAAYQYVVAQASKYHSFTTNQVQQFVESNSAIRSTS